MIKRLKLAAEAYERCAGMDPGVRPRDSLGFVSLLAGMHVEAVTQFRRATDIDPKFAPALNNLGLADDLADNRSMAKKRYENVIKKIDKKNVRAHVMLALDLWVDGSHNKAIKELDRALKIDPEDDLAWTFVGDIHYDNRKADSAIKAYKKATEINDRNFTAWYHMGIAYDDAKRKDEEADRCYRKALEAWPDPEQELVLRLAIINDDTALSRLDEALKFYQLYRDLGGTEEWVPERIEELKEQLAGDG
jgi:tetratricopeptide (TPR) repeat protein